MPEVIVVTKNENLVFVLENILIAHGISLSYYHDPDMLVEKDVIHSETLLVMLDVPKPSVGELLYLLKLAEELPVPVVMMNSKVSTVDRIVSRYKALDSLAQPMAEFFKILSDHRDKNFPYSWIDLVPGTVFDVACQSVKKNGEVITLTSTEFKILFLLCVHRGKKVTTSQELIQQADLINQAALYIHIKKLREKVEDDSRNPQLILTVRGKGYKLCQEVLTAGKVSS